VTHYDILPEKQRQLLPALKATRSLGYTLYGGTAIALQIGHRVSIDFDFFSNLPLDEAVLKRAIPVLANGETISRDSDTWTLVVQAESAGREVKLSFFGSLDFGRVGTPAITTGGEIALASLHDLMGHKLKVLLQRVEAKDYMDIAALLRAGLSLEYGLGAAKTMFATFPPLEAVRTMTYFEGGDLGRLSEEDKTTLVRAAAAVGAIVDVPRLSKSLAGPVPDGDDV